MVFRFASNNYTEEFRNLEEIEKNTFTPSQSGTNKQLQKAMLQG